MTLMTRTQQAMAAAQATTATRLPQVSTLPLPDDVRVRVHMQPDAPLGMIDVEMGFGQGSKGRGQRVGDDPAVHVAALRRLVAHLGEYLRGYEQEAATCEPDWWQRVAAAGAAFDPTPTH